ncbi:unnamed protein product [Mytilus edulis]|uniref:Uncharacterized protein n=1 Tax=Mytilus edulis TaxID=6550 RepID=A0A8S3QBK0_MYTED|nr:unnamed protein product [Mytilus edulis]
MKDYLHTVMTHSSKLQSFLGVHQIEQQVHQCQQYVDDLEEDDRTKEFDIKMEQNNEIEKTINKLGLLESIEVTVVKTHIAINRESDVKSEAQVESRERSNITVMTMKIKTKIKINIGEWIRNMTCLMDGSVIAIKQFGTVHLFTGASKNTIRNILLYLVKHTGLHR